MVFCAGALPGYEYTDLYVRSSDDWGAFGAAFSGALSKNGKLHLVWMRTTTIPTGNLWYTSCIDSGLVP